MSEQIGGLLQIPTSYKFKRQSLNNYRNKSIDPNNFHLWVKNDMYRSTYAHHHSPDSVEPKSYLIPGYGGFVPTNRAESIHAKTFTRKSKDIFADPAIHHNQKGLATTGFNMNYDAKIDKSKVANSCKYGKTGLQRPNPAWSLQSDQWISTTKDTYQSPQKYVNPTYKDTDKLLQTDQLHTKTSGYQQNRAYWDGNGWNPHPILNGKNNASEYRDRFNPEEAFHRNVQVSKEARLKPIQWNYKFNQ